MSTVKATNFSHPSAANPAIVLDAAGGATVAGMGLVLVSPTSIANSGGSASASGGAVTFTGVSSVSLNGVFTSAYENYLITFNGTISSTETARIRWRVGGVNNSTASSYSSQRANFDGSASLIARSVTDSAEFAVMGGTLRNIVSFTVFSPFLAQATVSHAINGFDNAGAWNAEIKTTRHNQTVSYDGFEIFLTGGPTLTGTIRVYGYKNS